MVGVWKLRRRWLCVSPSELRVSAFYITVHHCTHVHCTVQLVAIRETPDCVGPGRCGARRLAEDAGPATAVRSYSGHGHGDQS